MAEERVYDLERNGHVESGVAARQALSRIVNERIVQLDEGVETPGAGVAVVCECGTDGCFERIQLTRAEYEPVRAAAQRFVVLPDHVAAVERVVERREGYVVVERAVAPPGGPFGTQAPSISRVSAHATPQLEEVLAELEQAKTRTQQLEFALQSRIAIEQAKGILAERFGWDVDTAFEVLRSAARSARINIHQLARDVAAGEATPQPIVAALARRAGRRAVEANEAD